MKTTMKTLQRIIMCTLLILFLRCSKDEGSPGPDDGIKQQNGISEDDLEAYKGDLGIKIDLRSLSKKGYTPAKVVIDLGTTQSDYDQELIVNSFTNIAQLTISVEDLSPEAEDELRNGVSLDIEILDNNDTLITTDSYSIIPLVENGTDIPVNDDAIEFNNTQLHFKLEMPHFLQTVSADGSYGSNAVEKPADSGDNNTLLYEDYSSFSPNWSNHQYYFYKLPNEDNVFAIWSKNSGRYLLISDEAKNFKQSGGVSYPEGLNDNSLGDIYKIRIQKEANGLYTFRKYSSNLPLRQDTNSTGIHWNAIDTGAIQYFRVIALNLQWDVQELDTKYLSPILPAVDTSFGFNSTLVNCGSGSLEQEVGIERTVTTSRTVGWEESFSISSRETFGGSVTVGVEAEANFFAGSVTASAEATASYEYSQEVSSSQSQFGEITAEETNTYFSSRTVTVPAGSASLVYDAYQTYSNVKIPFVKRFRIFADQIDPTNNIFVGVLSGNAIATQLRITNFKGVITNISSDYVEVTLRGTSVLDNMVDTQSEVQDVAANCN